MRFPFFWASEQRSAFDIPRPAPTTGHLEVYRFTARQVVAAIAFHLVDEGIAPRVCPRSCHALARCLAPDGEPDRPLLTVSQAHWRRMTHRERLHWLLERTQTRIDLSPDDGTARLSF